MVTSYRSITNPDQVCISLGFDKGNDLMFQTICARIEGGDECEAIDSMASMAELVTIKTQRDGYKRSKPDINVERCLFTNKAAFFSDILKYLNLRGIKFAVEYFSGGSRPFWRLCEGINFYGNKNR